MSSKPTVEELRWAVTAGGVESSAQEAPDTDHKDTGYDDDEVPTAKEFNYLLRRNFAWAKYLSDGALTGGLSLDSLTVSGLTALRSELQVAPALAPTSFVFTSVAGGLGFLGLKVAHGLKTGDGPWVFSNTGGALPLFLTPGTPVWPVVVDADHFSVATSRARAIAKIYINFGNAGTGVHTITSAATATQGSRTHGATGTPDSDLGSTSPILNMTGRITVDGQVCATDFAHTAIRTLTLHPSSAATGAGGPTYDPVNKKWVLSATGVPLDFPIPLSIGDFVLGIKVYYHKGSGSGTNLVFGINARAAPGSPGAAVYGTVPGNDVSNNDASAAPGDTFITIGPFFGGSPALDGAALSVEITSTAGSASDSVASVQVFIQRPPAT